jgi:hypothetical protein
MPVFDSTYSAVGVPNYWHTATFVLVEGKIFVSIIWHRFTHNLANSWNLKTIALFYAKNDICFKVGRWIQTSRHPSPEA